MGKIFNIILVVSFLLTGIYISGCKHKKTAKDIGDKLCSCIKLIPDSNNYQYIDSRLALCFDSIKDNTINATEKFAQELMAYTYSNCDEFTRVTNLKQTLAFNLNDREPALEKEKCKILRKGTFKVLHYSNLEGIIRIKQDTMIHQIDNR